MAFSHIWTQKEKNCFIRFHKQKLKHDFEQKDLGVKFLWKLKPRAKYIANFLGSTGNFVLKR